MNNTKYLHNCIDILITSKDIDSKMSVKGKQYNTLSSTEFRGYVPFITYISKKTFTFLEQEIMTKYFNY